MLTKQIKFEDSVLEIIKTMEWSDDGKLGKLTCGQLDRTMYTKVNKALDAMGGKWNRKLGGHVFKTDPRSSVEGLLENGSLRVERDGFFETPIEVVNQMLSLIEVKGKILEPSAGLGAIAGQLNGDLTCIERNEQRVTELSKKYKTICGDFLEHTEKYDTIVMNPPFENLQDIDHVKHAYELLNDGGQMVSVVSESPFFRDTQKAVEFREWLSEVGYDVKLPEGSFKSSGTGVNTRLVVIKK